MLSKLSFVAAIAATVPGAVQAELQCNADITVNCAAEGELCEEYPAAGNAVWNACDNTGSTYLDCQKVNVNGTDVRQCVSQAIEDEACMESDDCVGALKCLDSLMDPCTQETGCTCVDAKRLAPSVGCHGVDDACDMDTDCAFGDCVSGRCAGLGLDEPCSEEYECGVDYYCSKDAPRKCVPRLADGEDASDTQGPHACQSRWYTDKKICKTPVVVLDGEACDSKKNGTYCGFTSHCKDLVCVANTDMVGASCSKNGDCKPTNNGDFEFNVCSCDSGGETAVCTAPYTSCDYSALESALLEFEKEACVKGKPGSGDGRCTSGGYNEDWEGSCFAREDCPADAAVTNCLATDLNAGLSLYGVRDECNYIATTNEDVCAASTMSLTFATVAAPLSLAIALAAMQA